MNPWVSCRRNHEHTLVLARWLREDGYDERIIYAILAHNDLNQATHPRNNLLSHALYACDEITGIIMATAPVTKCHSRKLSTILPELIALFSLPPAQKEYAALH